MTENAHLQLLLKRADAVLTGQDVIRAELGEMKLKVGTLAESMVSMRKDMAGLRTDLRMIAIAVDQQVLGSLHIRDLPSPCAATARPNRAPNIFAFLTLLL